MDESTLIDNEPASSDYVLAVLRDMHRHSSQFDDMVDSDFDMSFNTTIAEWRKGCDLLDWRELGRAQNEFWHIHCEDEEWRTVLEPPQKRKLVHVCQFIARHANRPQIRQAGLFGIKCHPAGAFLAIRSLLKEAGEDVKDLATSTPLAEYTRRHCLLFLDLSIKLAPGAMPAVWIFKPKYDSATRWLVVGMLGTLAGLILGALTGWHVLTIAGALLSFISYLAVQDAARSLPERVEFGDLQTFRDWCVAIARGNSRSRS